MNEKDHARAVVQGGEGNVVGGIYNPSVICGAVGEHHVEQSRVELGNQELGSVYRYLEIDVFPGSRRTKGGLPITEGRRQHPQPQRFNATDADDLSGLALRFGSELVAEPFGEVDEDFQLAGEGFCVFRWLDTDASDFLLEETLQARSSTQGRRAEKELGDPA